ncbi:MAG: DMT family transporter [Terriglobia bacterium]
MRAKAEVLLVVVTVFWGATFVIVKEALKDASPLVFIAGRFTLAGILLWLAVGEWKLRRRSLGPAMALGSLLFAGYFFQTWGQEYTTPSKCAFITSLSVVLVPLIVAATGIPLRWASAAGASCGLAGIFLLTAPFGGRAINRGDLLTLAGAVAFAGYIVLLEIYNRRHSFAQLAAPQILAVGVLAFILLPFDRGRRFHWTPGLGWAFVATAIFATAFAFGVQTWAQKYVPASHTALIFALEPVFAALTSYSILGERLGVSALAGAGLVLAGMVLSELWGAPAQHPA